MGIESHKSSNNSFEGKMSNPVVRLSPPEDNSIRGHSRDLISDLADQVIALEGSVPVTRERAVSLIVHDVQYGGKGTQNDLALLVKAELRERSLKTNPDAQPMTTAGRIPSRPATRISPLVSSRKKTREHRPEDGYQPTPLDEQ